jgi:phage terminase small subunit
MPYTHDAEGLTPKRRAFVAEYLIDFNATQAAMRAGYGAKSAHTMGSRLLRLPPVKASVEAALAARAERTRVTADRVIAEYARLAFADMRRYAEWGETGVKLRAHTSLDADDAAAVVEVAPVGQSGRAKIRLHDKRPALDALARHLGLWGVRPRTADFTNAEQRAARQILRERIEKIIAERPKPAAAVNDNGDGDSEPAPPPRDR